MGKNKKKSAHYSSRKKVETPNSSRISLRICLVSAVFVLIILLSFAYIFDFGEHQLSPDMSDIKQNLREWPLIPYKRKKVESVKLDVPKLKVIKCKFENGECEKKIHMIAAKFVKIIKSCPDHDISHKLYGMLNDGSLKIKIVANMGNTMGLFSSPNPEIGILLPRITVPLEGITRVYEIYGITKFWLMLVHEFQHYKQWAREGMPHAKNFNAEPADIWSNEREAFMAGCRAAIRWGVRSIHKDMLGDMCYAIDNPKAFDQQVFKHSFEGPSISETFIYKAHMFEIAKLAGHPYPEAYR